jgi:hypothetical protein
MHIQNSVRFVLVNDREPRNSTFCALCCEPICNDYVREPQTRLAYCSVEHFIGHCQVAVALLEDHSRRAS